MKKKLQKLLQRAKNLEEGDDKELNDIIAKAKMCFNIAFSPDKDSLYNNQIDNISYKSPYGNLIKDDTNYWKKGKNELINYLDTRIEELELNESQNKKIKNLSREIEKTPTEDLSQLNELKENLKNCLKKRKLNYGLIVTIIGGAFIFGWYFGNNKFDQKKIDLSRDLILYKDSITNQKKIISSKSKEIEKLKDSIYNQKLPH